MPHYADESGYTQAEIDLWEKLKAWEGRPFRTVKGLEFSYRIVGNELFVDRKDKSLTRATVNRAYRVAVGNPAQIVGPKKLGTFGASYLFALFQALGILPGAADG